MRHGLKWVKRLDYHFLVWHITATCYVLTRKFYIRRNNNKVDSIETGPIVIAYLPPLSDFKKCMYTTFLKLMMMKFYPHYLIY